MKYLFKLLIFVETLSAGPLLAQETLVVTGLAQETSIAAGPGILTATSGGSASRLKAQLAAIDPRRIKAVVVFGIAGGLNPALTTGEVILPSSVVTGEGTWPTTPALVASLKAPLVKHHMSVTSGILAGEDDVAANPTVKAQLRYQTGADAVDTESQVAAPYAAAHGLPFAVLRVISDMANQSLPPAAIVPLNADGSPNLFNIIGSIFTDPAQLPALIETGEEADAAFSVLRRCHRYLGL